MNISTPNILPQHLTADRALHGFESIASVTRPFDAHLADERAVQAREAAQQLVSTALITPLLAELRDTTFQSELFHGGFAENAFRQQMDQIIGDRIVKNMDEQGNFPLVDKIYRSMMQSMQPAPTPKVNEHA